MSRLKVVLVEIEPARMPMVSELMDVADCDVVAHETTITGMVERAAARDVDLVVVATGSADDRLLEGLVALQGAAPTPVVLFASDDSAATIRRAVQAGVSAYVTDGVTPARVRSILEAAMARFRQFKALAEELQRTRSQLTERKLIERAKGIIMAQRGLSEDEAYKLMRKTAMDRNKRMVDIADSIIAASDLLGTSAKVSQGMPLGLA